MFLCPEPTNNHSNKCKIPVYVLMKFISSESVWADTAFCLCLLCQTS